MKVSVVIPAYNNEDYVAYTLQKLNEQECSFDDWEILLVDDSEDDRMRMFENKGIKNLRVIEKPHSGRADSRNAGILASEAEVIVFMDSDMIVDKNFVERHYYAHINTDIDVVLGKVNHIPSRYKDEAMELIKNGEPEDLRKFVENEQYVNLAMSVFKNRDVADKVGWICCLFSNSSVKRSVFERTGLFDIAFVGWGLEDIELGYRFHKSGLKYGYFEDIENYHLDHVANRDLMLSEMARNLKVFSVKHTDKIVKSYMSFVAGFKNLKQLYEDAGGSIGAFAEGEKVFFMPLNYSNTKTR
ncbi:MAG: glycosyltransferase family 2 protein [Lachnospiraceae bacterium]|nr:glycosyltransferase family 2 protein [Lachnospiraceae bacterium]